MRSTFQLLINHASSWKYEHAHYAAGRAYYIWQFDRWMNWIVVYSNYPLGYMLVEAFFDSLQVNDVFVVVAKKWDVLEKLWPSNLAAKLFVSFSFLKAIALDWVETVLFICETVALGQFAVWIWHNF